MFPNTRSGQGLSGISCRKTSPAVFPVFFRLPYTGLPDPERQKNHCESAGQANFSPIPQKPCFDSPENVCRQILRVTAPFLFRRPPFSAVFPPENAPFPSDNKPFSSFGNAGLDCFGREGKRFFHEHRAAFQIPPASLAQFSRNPDTRQDHERYFFRFAGFRNPPHFACQAVRTGFDRTAWRLSGFPAIFCARTRPAFPPDAGMV